MNRLSHVFFLLLLAVPAWAPAATTPAPSAAPHAAPTQIQLPNLPLHTEFVVEVNKHGQVVRVKSSKPCKVDTFNVQTYGNAMQMWIRKPDGTATVGLYRVTYDYDPKSHHVDRNIAMVSEGGNWGDEEGAANVMMNAAQKEAAAAAKKRQQDAAGLPSLNQITGKSPAPSASPH